MMMKVTPEGYDMEMGASCGAGADKGMKTGYDHHGQVGKPDEAKFGAISIPPTTPIQTERPNG